MIHDQRLRWGLGLAFLGLIGFSGTPARGDVIFSDLGSGGTFSTNQNNAYVVAGASSIFGATYGEGASFTPTTTATVSQIDVAVSTYLGLGNGNFTLQLWSSTGSSGSTAIGSMIDSFTVLAGSTAGVVSVLTPDHPVLAAGQTYYLIEQPLNANSVVLWYQNSTGASGQIYESKNGVVDYRSLTLPAFDVLSPTTSSVPEPSPAFLGVVAAGLLGGARWVKRRARRA